MPHTILSKKGRLGLISAIFGAASIGIIVTATSKPKECCTNPLTAKLEDINFRPLNSGDVYIPVYNQRIVEDNKLQFEIDKDKINGLAFLFAKTASMYTTSVKPDGRLCPYIDLDDKYSSKQKLPGGRTLVTMTLNQTLIDVVSKHHCVVTTRPDP